MKKFVRILASLLAFSAALMAGLLQVKNRLPRGMLLWIPKLMANALAPLWGLAGAAGSFLGVVSGWWPAALLGGWGARVAWGYLQSIARTQPGFEKAFGPAWESQIPTERQSGLLPSRWAWKLPAAPQARVLRDLPFWQLENGRTLLCDLWLPAAAPSGLALIYFHGSDWYMMDKDAGTSAIFRHLAAQGHAVMDVAYRLAPETDLAGMVGDVKRALAWLKAHAAEYALNPNQIVLMGSSAGGHIALLTAFAPYQPEMTPAELKDLDLSVCAVVSLYGPCDLRACYEHTQQDLTTGRFDTRPVLKTPNPRTAARMRQLLGARYERWGLDKDPLAGSFLYLLGGHPRQIPEAYALYSPLEYVNPGCPPVFLAQGEDDLITPVAATRAMAAKLQAAGVPVINLIFPQTDHGFELALPAINPAAQVTLYELDRFLALCCRQAF